MKRFALTCILVLSCLACTTWGRQYEGSAVLSTQNRLSRVRLYLSDRRMIELWDASTRSDTIFGQRVAESGQFEAVAFPTSDILAVELREFDGTRTAGVVVGFVAALAWFFFSALPGSYTT